METEGLLSNLGGDMLLLLLYTVHHVINSGTTWGTVQGGGGPPEAGYPKVNIGLGSINPPPPSINAHFQAAPTPGMNGLTVRGLRDVEGAWMGSCQHTWEPLKETEWTHQQARGPGTDSTTMVLAAISFSLRPGLCHAP